MNQRLAELLKAQPAGQPMGDELIDLLTTHLVTEDGTRPDRPLDDALREMLAQAIRLVETLHEIRKL